MREPGRCDGLISEKLRVLFSRSSHNLPFTSFPLPFSSSVSSSISKKNTHDARKPHVIAIVHGWHGPRGLVARRCSTSIIHRCSFESPRPGAATRRLWRLGRRRRRRWRYQHRCGRPGGAGPRWRSACGHGPGEAVSVFVEGGRKKKIGSRLNDDTALPF